MGQNEVWKYMEKYPKRWFSVSDIKKFIGGEDRNAASALNKLRKFGFVYRKKKDEIRKSAGSNRKNKYTINYFKLVPKGKIVKYGRTRDILVDTKNKV